MRRSVKWSQPLSMRENVVQLLYSSTQSGSINTKETGDTPQGNESQRKLEAVTSGIKSASGWIHEDDVLLRACSMRGLECTIAIYP
jgi:hypothetical protein